MDRLYEFYPYHTKTKTFGGEVRLFTPTPQKKIKEEVTEKEEKKKMKANKAGSIFLITILALAGIGVAYAGWTDTITVTGSANTGTVDWNVVEYSGTWVFKMPDHGREIVQEQYATYDSNIPTEPSGFVNVDPNGWVAASWAEKGSQEDTVKVTFENIYPLDADPYFDADITIQYDGTIPGRIHSITPLPLETPDAWGDTPDEQAIDQHTDLLITCIKADGTEVDVPQSDIPGYQLHKGDQLHVVMRIVLPQEPELMSLSGSFEYEIEILQWSDDCDFEQFPEKDLVLPAWIEGKLHHWGADSYWDFTINNLPDNIPGVYSPPINQSAVLKAWCCDEYTTIPNNYVGTFTVHYDDRNTYHPGHDDNTPDDVGGITPWDCIDYIINHDDAAENGGTEYNKDSVQKAMWYYVNGGNLPSGNADAMAIIADVNANAIAWINAGHPTMGDMTAVIIDPNDDAHTNQICFIEVDP